jgi:hypothetical protein
MFTGSVFDKLEQMGIIKKVDKKTKTSSMGKALDKAVETGVIRIIDDEYGKKYAQIYDKGGIVNKYSHGGSVDDKTNVRGVNKKIQTQGFKFNHTIS